MERIPDKTLLDADWKKERPTWKLSSYAAAKGEPNLFQGPCDVSQEEARWQAYSELRSSNGIGNYVIHILCVKRTFMNEW
jgi:hypothetical protein